ncbi:hypothetical protein PM082_007551 [Marasmius tenuissimus]|nr:hypothetical protein PM082_007551 [Marasmius tenuissimus]
MISRIKLIVNSRRVASFGWLAWFHSSVPPPSPTHKQKPSRPECATWVVIRETPQDGVVKDAGKKVLNLKSEYGETAMEDRDSRTTTLVRESNTRPSSPPNRLLERFYTLDTRNNARKSIFRRTSFDRPSKSQRTFQGEQSRCSISLMRSNLVHWHDHGCVLDRNQTSQPTDHWVSVPSIP